MKDKLIPAANPSLKFEKFQDLLNESFLETLSQGTYILGNKLKEFEISFASYIGTSACIGVNSGTDALILCLKAIGINPGDEIITTSISAPATAIAILNAGATPVIVDVEPPVYCISPQEIRKAITKKTRAIIPVHLHGYAARMDEIVQIAKEHDLAIIEDCAQAHGATFNSRKLGTFGICAAFSFYPTKNLGCIGDGGAVVTNSQKIAQKISELRFYGFGENNLIENAGLNSRLDEMQAAFLGILLHHLDDENSKRSLYAKKYDDLLIDYPEIRPPIIEGSVYHQYAIRVKNRDKFRQNLLDMGIGTNVHYSYTMKDHPLLKKYCKSIPVAEKVVNEFVSLPIQPEILDDHFEEISQKVILCLKNH